MEIEASPAPIVAKKLWNIIRIMMIMLRKGIAKSKAMTEFNLLLKRGKLAIANTLTLHHHHFGAAFACHRPNNNLSILSPCEYEFSCSNSPAINHHHCHCDRHRRHRRFSKRCKCDDVLTASAVQKVLEMLNNNNNSDHAVVEGGNYTYSPLPGFRKSPIGKQLRITDSPFPLKEEGDDGGQVDVAAEEFIKRFYKNLNSQHKQVDAMDSPYYSYHNYSWDR